MKIKAMSPGTGPPRPPHEHRRGPCPRRRKLSVADGSSRTRKQAVPREREQSVACWKTVLLPSRSSCLSRCATRLAFCGRLRAGDGCSPAMGSVSLRATPNCPGTTAITARTLAGPGHAMTCSISRHLTPITLTNPGAPEAEIVYGTSLSFRCRGSRYRRETSESPMARVPLAWK